MNNLKITKLIAVKNTQNPSVDTDGILILLIISYSNSTVLTVVDLSGKTTVRRSEIFFDFDTVQFLLLPLSFSLPLSKSG